MPFLHEPSVTLELVNLNTAHLLLSHGGDLFVFGVTADRKVGLLVLLLLKLLQMRLHVELFLWLVERVNAGLEELVLHSVILFLRVGNFLSRLVVAKLTGFGQDSDISDRVNLFKAHLELIE